AHRAAATSVSRVVQEGINIPRVQLSSRDLHAKDRAAFVLSKTRWSSTIPPVPEDGGEKLRST
ncbi:hypothetical protein, partial [Frankia sp. Cr1]|uniref:hypothetical protein n=1 Tax=Frankia sp. Cr1 TaxID=3073931 RepID=UPI002AD43FAC